MRRAVPILVVLIAGRSAAAEVDTSVGVRLGAGYDSNPLLVMDDGPSGAFGQLDFDARLDVRPAPTTELFVRSAGWARSHASPVADADTWGGELRVGIALPRLGTPAHRLSMAVGARASTRHDTFVDRSSGRTYEVDLGSANPSVPIPDRYSFDATGAFLSARFRSNPRLLFSFDGRLDSIDYADDYDGMPTLGSIDYSSFALEPGVYVKVAEPVSLGLSIVFSGLDYAHLDALDASGAPAGTTRTYGSVEYRLVVAAVPAPGWGARLGHRRLDQTDRYAGYYSYASTTSFLSVARDFGSKAGVEIEVVRSELDYDHAVVPGATDGSVRRSDFTGFTGRFHKTLGVASLRWFSEAGVQRSDSRDPVFAYGREWIMTGMEFRR